MIQRIQSVFFFIAAVFPALLFVLPLYTVHIAATGLTPEMHTDIFIAKPVGTYSMYYAILAVMCTLLPLVAIFLYKNRPLQIRLGRLNILLLTVALVFLVVAYASLDSGVTAGIGLFMPSGGIIFTFLAIRAIGKDEALVKSADRIR